MPPSRLVFSIVVVLALNLAGCPANNPETSAPPTILIQETDYRGVIFSAAEAEQQRLEVPMTADTVEFWSPTAADIARLEAQLLPALLADERLSDGVGFNPVQPLAAALPDSAGSSGMFERGVITYSNDGKTALLGVSVEALETSGAVSEVVAAQMAQGARATAAAEIAVAITGIAGPGGSEFKPEGRV